MPSLAFGCTFAAVVVSAAAVDIAVVTVDEKSSEISVKEFPPSSEFRIGGAAPIIPSTDNCALTKSAMPVS